MDTTERSAFGPAFLRRTVLVPLLAGTALTGLACGPDRAGAPANGVDAPTTPMIAAANPVDAGRYVAAIGGCNDCHTDGFMENGGSTPEPDRLTGSVVGFRGPWGTTYPPNLRLTVMTMTEDLWVETLRNRTGLPPMPWPSVNAMSEQDARALYAYLRALGPAGELRYAPLGPDVEPTTPWMDFTSRNLPAMAAPHDRQ